MEYETDNVEEIEVNNNAKQNEQCVINTDPIVMHNLDGRSIDPSQIVNIASAEGQILVSHTK